MSRMHGLKAGVLWSLMWAMPVCAADFSSYRGIQFGANVETAAKQAGAQSSEAKVIHRRPALIQELDWQPDYSSRMDSQNPDPVRDGLLRFYNGELFQIISTYAPQRVEGMTDADIVEVISATYGPAAKPTSEIPYHTNYGETARVIARWENTEYSYNLVRTGDRTSYALILSQKRMDALAQAAIRRAVLLDAQQAPQRAIDLQKQQEMESRIQLDKARSANKSTFRP